MWEASLDFLVEAARRGGAQRPEPWCEPELAALGTDEVQDGEAILVLVQAKAAPELLEVDGKTLGRAEKEHGVHRGDIHTLVVQVHHEDKVHLARVQPLLGTAAFVVGSVGRKSDRWKLPLIEEASHEMGM